MENKEGFQNVVADFDFRFILGFVGVSFIIGVLVNLPAVTVYIQKKHLRAATDKFIFFVLCVDILSLVIFLPISFFIILQASSLSKIQNETVSNKEERPFFTENGDSIGLGKESIDTLNDSESKELPNHFCVQQWMFIIHKAVFLAMANMSMMGALKIAVERYLVVVTPLHYHKLLKTSSVLLISLVSFCLSISGAVAMSLLPSDENSLIQLMFHNAPNVGKTTILSFDDGRKASYKEDPIDQYFESLKMSIPQQNAEYFKESLAQDKINVWWPVLKLAHATVFFIIPIVVLIPMYLRIWMEARKQNARMTMMGHHPNTFIVPGSAEDTKKSQEENETSLHSIVGKFNLVQRLRRRTRMDRAARVAILTIGLSLLSYGPLYLSEILSAIFSIQKSQGMRHTFPDESHKQRLLQFKFCLSIILASLHPILSPLVYIYRYKKVRSELGSIIHKMISSSSCSEWSCKKVMTNKERSPAVYQDALYQINELAQKLPSSSVTERMIESQQVSNADSDDTVILTVEGTSVSSASPSVKGNEVNDNSSENEDNCRKHGPDLESCMENHNFQNEPEISSAQPNNGLFYIINSWVHSYSRRWNHHRESVTSTTSVVTLLSNPNHTVPSEEP